MGSGVSFQAQKSWLTVQNQLDLLKQRGLIINDASKTMHYLETLGYYRLSGYFYPFRQFDSSPNAIGRKNQFIKGTQFDDIVRLYAFDKGLRLLAFDALERIEMAFRVDVAYVLGRRSPNAHEYAENLDAKFCSRSGKLKNGKSTYNQKSDHHAWLEKYDALVARSKNQACIKHNLETYGCLPIWVAVEILDFGALSRLYGGLKYKDRQEIANRYQTEPAILAKWFRSLNFIRNVVAHHGRLWNINMVDRCDFDKSFPNDVLALQLENNKPFAYFYLMAYLLKIISPDSDWKSRLVAHIDSFPLKHSQVVSIEDFGYLSDFQSHHW